MLDVFFARPRDLDRLAVGGDGEKRSVAGKIHFGAPPEAAAHHGGVDNHILLIEPGDAGADVTREGRRLIGRPEFEFAGLRIQ